VRSQNPAAAAVTFVRRSVWRARCPVSDFAGQFHPIEANSDWCFEVLPPKLIEFTAPVVAK